jgi:hypothetical protein
MTLSNMNARCIDSFTNALAFSPTDTMPLMRIAKMLMLVESQGSTPVRQNRGLL